MFGVHGWRVCGRVCWWWGLYVGRTQGRVDEKMVRDPWSTTVDDGGSGKVAQSSCVKGDS
jgi:hypothetical protein